MPGAKWSISSTKCPADVDLIRLLFCEYRDETDGEGCFEDFEAEMAALPGRYKEPKGILILAKLKGEPVGCIALSPLNANVKSCEIKRLYVRAAYRGHGLGRNLVRRVLRHAKSRKYHRAVLYSLPSMKEAHALYQSFGFKVMKSREGQTTIEMQLSLI
ncbi:MAG: GNAT family N-acetyltransferase [Fimbriimonadaceae bacterium]